MQEFDTENEIPQKLLEVYCTHKGGMPNQITLLMPESDPNIVHLEMLRETIKQRVEDAMGIPVVLLRESPRPSITPPDRVVLAGHPYRGFHGKSELAAALATLVAERYDAEDIPVPHTWPGKDPDWSGEIDPRPRKKSNKANRPAWRK